MSAPTDPAGESVALEALLLARARLYALFHKLFGAAPDAAAIEALLGEATLAMLMFVGNLTPLLIIMEDALPEALEEPEIIPT